MGFKLNIMAINAPYSDLEDILDVMHVTKSGASFEEATSVELGNALSTTFINGHILIFDVQCRFFYKSKFPREVSLKYDLKMYQILETAGYMLLSGGKKTLRFTGKKDCKAELERRNIPLKDKWGETLAWQLFDDDIFGKQQEGIATELWNAKFDIWELD